MLNQGLKIVGPHAVKEIGKNIEEIQSLFDIGFGELSSMLNILKGDDDYGKISLICFMKSLFTIWLLFADDFFGSDDNEEETTTTTSSNDNEEESSVVLIPEIPEFDMQKLNFKRVINYPLNSDLKSNENNKK